MFYEIFEKIGEKYYCVYSDIENKAEYSASNKGNTFNTAIKTTAEKTADGKTKIVSKDIIESSAIMSMPVNGNSSSTTKSAIADGTVEIRSNPNQDISGLSRDTNKALNELGKIFDKKECFYEYKIHKQIILPKTAATTESLQCFL